VHQPRHDAAVRRFAYPWLCCSNNVIQSSAHLFSDFLKFFTKLPKEFFDTLQINDLRLAVLFVPFYFLCGQRNPSPARGCQPTP